LHQRMPNKSVLISVPLSPIDANANSRHRTAGMALSMAGHHG
jgi:hypothetical protein